MPSRVRSPTPQKTDLPPWPFCTLLMSSMMTTVLPTPAPPKRPILPPFTNGAIRSMTLMPVSKTVVLGSRSTNFGVSRWIGQRSTPAGIGAPPSTGSPSTLRIRPSGHVADRHRDGRPGVDDLHPAHHAVGGAHGHRAHLVLPDVLLHLGHEPDRLRGAGVLEEQGVVDLGQLPGLELDVEDGADDLDDRADVGCDRCGGHAMISCVVRVSAIYPWSAAAPPTISAISCVIAAWRWRL